MTSRAIALYFTMPKLDSCIHANISWRHVPGIRSLRPLKIKPSVHASSSLYFQYVFISTESWSRLSGHPSKIALLSRIISRSAEADFCYSDYFPGDRGKYDKA